MRHRANPQTKSRAGVPLTQERLRALLDYNAVTGEFTWRSPGMGRSADLRAGSVAKIGYVYIAVDGRKQLAHRLAWLWMTGAFPNGPIDHRDGRRDNNAFSNLREADAFLNGANMRRHKRNTTGYKGVVKVDGCNLWTARIKAFGEHRYIGSFDSPEAAHAAYCAAAHSLFGAFANPGKVGFGAEG